jgi:hypothetical protein
MKNVNSRRAFLGKAACFATVATVSPLAGFGKNFEKAMDETKKTSVPSSVVILVEVFL